MDTFILKGAEILVCDITSVSGEHTIQLEILG